MLWLGFIKVQRYKLQAGCQRCAMQYSSIQCSNFMFPRPEWQEIIKKKLTNQSEHQLGNFHTQLYYKRQVLTLNLSIICTKKLQLTVFKDRKGNRPKHTYTRGTGDTSADTQTHSHTDKEETPHVRILLFPNSLHHLRRSFQGRQTPTEEACMGCNSSLIITEVMTTHPRKQVDS